MNKLQIFFKTICMLPLAAMAQSTDMETDRPSETLSPNIVLKKHVQVEAGFRREHGNDEGERHDEYLYPTALIKYGLTNKIELRLSIEEETDYDYVPEKHKTASGLEPIKVGVKYNLVDGKGIVPKTSVIARADIPKWASSDFKSDFVAPLFRLAMENSISKKLSFVYNIGEEWEEDDVHGRFFYSASPQLEITKKLKVFAEIFGYISKAQTAENTFDAGLLYQIKQNLQFDIFSGIGISKSSPNNYVEAGISFRLPD